MSEQASMLVLANRLLPLIPRSVLVRFPELPLRLFDPVRCAEMGGNRPPVVPERSSLLLPARAELGATLAPLLPRMSGSWPGEVNSPFWYSPWRAESGEVSLWLLPWALDVLPRDFGGLKEAGC
jgi:hypothetical protein